SGSHAAVAQAIEWCEQRDLRARRLNVACAFHSPLVAPAQRRLAEMLGQVAFSAPRLPVYSNTTGQAYPSSPAAIASMLSDHLVQPVEFVREIEQMYHDGARVFVEVGPRNTLTSLASRILGDRPHVGVPLDQPGRPGLVQLVHGLASLASEGVAVDLARLFEHRTVSRLDLAGLDERRGQPVYSPTTWLVNGGGARPASRPKLIRDSLRVAVLEEGEEVRAAGAELVAANGQPALPVQAGGEVLAQFELVMQQFLETQRAVMTQYLAGGTAAPLSTAAASAAPVQAVQPAIVSQPAAVEPPVEPVPEKPAPAPAKASVLDCLLQVVSERTGYPTDMLGLDLDLEADLGIDSIKRVEIAGTLVQLLGLSDADRPDMEKLAGARTLQHVLKVLGPVVADQPVAAEEAPAGAVPAEASPAIGRFTLMPVIVEAEPVKGDLASDGVAVIVDDGHGVGAALADRLRAEGRRAVRVLTTSNGHDGNACSAVDLGSPAAVASLVADIHQNHGRASALIYLRPLGCGPAPAMDFDSWRPELAEELSGLFLLTQSLLPDLSSFAANGGAAVLAATALGGAHGVEMPSSEFFPGEGGVTGFLKSLAQEAPAVRVKSVDVALTESSAVAAWLFEELFAADGIVEIGYREGQRIALELVEAPLYVGGEFGDEPAPLNRDSVLLVTGGARGITAEAVALLAERYQPRLVLVGRTPLRDAPETPATVGLTEPQAIKRALIEERRAANLPVSLPEVETACRELLQEREVRATLARLQASGAAFEYRVCDVRDSAAFGALIDGLYATHGRIDGVIHGAGVIEDKLIADKAPDSFQRVIDVKVAGAVTLARKLRPESLRFLVFFSSVSGRFGNRGQADYAAASEMLNKLAQHLDRAWPGRVVAINWGPWLTTGMVSPEVQRQFAERGVALIPVETGCRMLDEELRSGRKGEAEVVIGGGQGPSGSQAAKSWPLLGAVPQPSGDSFEVGRALALEHDLYLTDHQLDGKPVFPFAFAAELMAETAAAACPDLEVAEVKGERLLKGIVLEGAPLPVRVTARAVERSAARATFELAVLSDVEPVRGHYRASVVLSRRLEPDAPAAWANLPRDPFPMPVEAAYREWLFHGPLFQHVDAIEASGPQGMLSIVHASSPDVCLRDASGAWLFDPVLMDAGFQLQVLWARQHWDVTLLPSSVGSYRRFGSVPSGPIRHELRIRPESREPSCHADHYFYDSDGRLVLVMTDVEGTGSKALNRLASAGRSLTGAVL
ncbi:MAG TPA: SDR family NAD(P)-dependent oxidoreductase, partial [Chloroflexota bacterium]|nr:SDR family NAD(P)-dependent oxidoreductase [Chloroflexota bacterium]